jgi:ABC-type uncharacterized transport system permease subunit
VAAVAAILRQAVWAVIMIAIGRAIMKRVMVRLQAQGG